MLEYRENINYYRDDDYNIDAELDELIQLLHDGIKDYEIYDQIRQYVYKDIKIKELAVTVILSDLHELRKTKPKTANLLEYFIANNTASYEDISREFGCSKQNVHEIIMKQADNYIWLKNLCRIKGIQDSKNDNKQKNKKQVQYVQDCHPLTLDLWEAIKNEHRR